MILEGVKNHPPLNRRVLYFYLNFINYNEKECGAEYEDEDGDEDGKR